MNTGRHNSRLWNSEPVFAFLIEEHRKNNGRTTALIEELGKTHHFFISVYYSLSWRNENHQYETIEDPYQESKNELSECYELQDSLSDWWETKYCSWDNDWRDKRELWLVWEWNELKCSELGGFRQSMWHRWQERSVYVGKIINTTYPWYRYINWRRANKRLYPKAVTMAVSSYFWSLEGNLSRQ